MQVNIEIEFPYCPWDLLSVTILDIVGTHIHNSEDNIQKIRIGKNNLNSKADPSDNSMNAIGHTDTKNPIEMALKASQSGEGCVIKGFLSLNRVDGSFNIGSKLHRQIANTIGVQTNLTHTIKNLSFGRRTHIISVQNKFKGRYGELTPLNGHSVTLKNYDDSTNYHLDVVPTTYHDRVGFKYSVFQFTYADASESSENNFISFKLSVKGVTVNYYLTSESLLQFVTQIWLIIGGVFTVSGLLTLLINKSLNAIYKAEIGKKD